MNATQLHARRAGEVPVLVRLREESGLSQPEIAKAMGTNVRRLRRMEQGRTRVSIEDTDALAAVFGVDGRDLYDALAEQYRSRRA